MSPIPYVRGQVIVLAILLTASAILGASIVALSCAAAASASAMLLGARYRHDLAVVNASTPPQRARLDVIVTRDACAALAPTTLLTVLSFAFSVEPSAGADSTARIVVGDLTIAAAAIYISSLVDWYVILPRISGQLGARPCRTGDPQFPFPHTWKEVTRWWYIHRISGALVFRVFLGLALATVIGDLIGAGEQTKVLVGLMMGMFAAYMAAIPWAVLEAAQVKVLVGQTVLVKARPRRQLSPPFPKVEPPDLRGRQYVVDISLEGVHLASVRSREEDPLPSPPEFLRHPDRIAVANLNSTRLSPQPFSACQMQCSGVNWYCIENPRCFEPK